MSFSITKSTNNSNTGTGGNVGGGAQFLTSRGIDTSSLFTKAQNLEFKRSTNAASTSSNVHATSTRTSANDKPLAANANSNRNANVRVNMNIHSTREQIRNQTISNVLANHKAYIHNLVNTKIHNQIIQEWETKTKFQLMNDIVVTVDEHGKLDRLLIDANKNNVGGEMAPYNRGKELSSLKNTNSFMTTTSNLNPIQLQDFYNLASYHHTNLFSSSQQQPIHPQKFIQMLVKISHELSLSNTNYYNPYYSASQLVSTLLSAPTFIAKSTTDYQTLIQNQQSYMAQPVPSPPFTITSPPPSSSTTTSTKIATVYQRTISSLLFLSNQFRDYLITKVKNSLSSNPISISSSSSFGLITYITKYIEIESGLDYFQSGSNNVLFKCIYYSLRCGDLQTAYDFYNSSNVSGGSGSVGAGGTYYGTLKKVLDHLLLFVNDKCKNNSSSTSSRDERCIALLEGLNNLPAAYIQEMNDLYHHVILNSANSNNYHDTATAALGGGNEYEIALLGMLSFSDLTNSGDNGSSSVANATIEDYIYLTLWNTLSPNGNMVEGVITLGDSIKSYGSDYFEGTVAGDDANSASCGWAYVMPLLLCQCYKTALVHLAQRGNGIGLCLAIHLILALSKSKQIMLVDIVDEKKLDNENSLKIANNDVISTLLVAYAKTLQAHSLPMALEYLIHIPDVVNSRIRLKNNTMVLSQKAEKQIVGLVLDTKAFDVFAGQVSADGSRLATGVLDIHFAPDGVSEILSAAANDCIHEGKVTDAAQLLSLAGQFTSLLSLLNRKLASIVVITKEDGMSSERQEQRQLWRDAALRFHSIYLSQGHSQVIQMLEAEQKISLGMDFQLLLNLMVFFDRCYNQDWNVSILFLLSFV